MPNSDQSRSWNGPTGEHWAAEAERYDAMLAPFVGPIVAAAAPQPGEAVLDVGCGNGALALAFAEQVAPGGRVTGVDLSEPMLAEARRRADAAGRGDVTFVRADAQTAALPGPFDVVVSRFGVMFFDDPTAAFTNLAASLRPGGRIVFVCWQDLS